uniref:Uncharacterized protein n=1 Tax=uncultured bacterium contig00005 TaxID=1181497 RepID=A0A806JZA9_9BACT|nr:hypothetical protein [uncultured bacterium contig00005]
MNVVKGPVAEICRKSAIFCKRDEEGCDRTEAMIRSVQSD